MRVYMLSGIIENTKQREEEKKNKTVNAYLVEGAFYIQHHQFSCVFLSLSLSIALAYIYVEQDK